VAAFSKEPPAPRHSQARDGTLQGADTAGHDASAPSLTGIGERVHLVSPQVGLTTHVTDVVHHVL
jgi:hypothetical protein